MDYDENFNGNIPYDLLDVSSNNILNWIVENREKQDEAKDPNAYEMTNLFLCAAKYRSQGKEVDLSAINQIWEIRKGDFGRCNISENNFVYRIVQDSYESAVSGKRLVNDSQSHSALRKIAGIGLHLYQQKRDNNQVLYNNPQELLELLNNAKNLAKFHPELYERYAVQSDINRICELQLSQDLPEQVKQAIKRKHMELQVCEQEHSHTKNNTNHSQHQTSLEEQKNYYLIANMIQDTRSIFEFINGRELESQMDNTSNTAANSYYYSLNFELSHAGLQNGATTGNLSRQIDDILKKYDVKLEQLLTLAQQSRACMEDKHSKEADEVYESLQNGARAHFNNKKEDHEDK